MEQNKIRLKKTIKIIIWVALTVMISVACLYLYDKFKKHFPLDSFLFALNFHFVLMGWYAFSLPYLKLTYKESYYDSKKIENKGKVYVYFGVNFFRWFLKKIGWDKASNISNGRIKKNLDRLKKREIHTREAEFAHLILFFHFVLIAFYLSFNFDVTWLLILNIILHIYPVFVQRYNRPRYLKLISIIEE